MALDGQGSMRVWQRHLRPANKQQQHCLRMTAADTTTHQPPTMLPVLWSCPHVQGDIEKVASRSPEQLTQLFEQISGSDVLAKPYEVRAPCGANRPMLSLHAARSRSVVSNVRLPGSVLDGAVLLWLLPPLLLTLCADSTVTHPPCSTSTTPAPTATTTGGCCRQGQG